MRNLILVAALAAVALTGCMKDTTPMEAHYSPNGIEVQTLFVNNGCTVYKFYDNRYVYYADCKASVSTDEQHSCGKGCVSNDDVVTMKPAPEAK